MASIANLTVKIWNINVGVPPHITGLITRKRQHVWLITRPPHGKSSTSSLRSSQKSQSCLSKVQQKPIRELPLAPARLTKLKMVFLHHQRDVLLVSVTAVLHLFHTALLWFYYTTDIFAWKRSESYLTSIQGWVMEGRDVGNEALKYKSISCRDYQSYLTGM